MMLNGEPKDWLKYWRNSLADTESANGVLTRTLMGQLRSFYKPCFQLGSLSGDMKFTEHRDALFKGESQETLVVKVLLRPFVLNSLEAHGKKHESIRPSIISPIVCPVWVSRSGQFFPAERPTIPRDMLAPQAEDVLTFFDVAELDKFNTLMPFEGYSDGAVESLVKKIASKDKEVATEAYIACRLFWGKYYELTRKLYETFLNAYGKSRLESEYLEPEKQTAYLIKIDDAVSMGRNILCLYDWLQDTKRPLPLVETFAKTVAVTRKPNHSFEGHICARMGHSNSKFPLASAQRDALVHTLSLDKGDILAINGPPGTGKTTFVLSLVASLWIRAAVAESEPPLIVAASVNNQAVTNILDAFGKDFEENDLPMSGRWLPDLWSYGGFFAAQSREAEAAETYQTKSFFQSLEVTEYLERAEAQFLKRGRKVLRLPATAKVRDIRARLHGQLLHWFKRLQAIEKTWRAYKTALATLEALAGGCVKRYQAACEAQLQTLEQAEDALRVAQKDWDAYVVAEPLSLQLFRWLPPVSRRLVLRRRLFIEEKFPASIQANFLGSGASEDSALKDVALVSEQLRNCMFEVGQKISAAQSVVVEFATAKQAVKKAAQAWRQAAHDVGFDVSSNSNAGNHADTDQDITQDIDTDFDKDIDTENVDISVIEKLDAHLDVTLRFHAFQIAVHYWEARWLEACRALQAQNAKKHGADWARPRANGEQASVPRWRRLMMLTPCIVSTLHSLPGHFSVAKRYMGKDAQERWESNYLANEIDWLILDEAGQISPEIVAAAMGLAKRAVAIGDVHQLAPVRSLTGSVDVGNLFRYGVINSVEDAEALDEAGVRVTSGSMMHVAHRVSPYHYMRQGEPGMYLREHRRCYDEIISFNNALCYQGLLQPRRGSASQDLPFPAMGYLHIDGFAQSGENGQSRQNVVEANIIAAWLEHHRDQIEAYYNRNLEASVEPLVLEDIVGVVTPFKLQKYQISRACKEHGIAVGSGQGELTVGTVHTLQGAERRIIIFSPVYSRHNNGGFIDNDPSLLNVAVSRAKDSFLVFGDMDVISGAPPGQPRRILSEFLLGKDTNALAFKGATRPDLLKHCRQPNVIKNAEDHDAYLRMIFEYAKARVVLVSPWIILDRLEKMGFLELMAQACARGIEVSIYTDYHFNTKVNNNLDDRRAAAFERCCQCVHEQGVVVYVVDRVHSKLLLVDNDHMAVGSFNWLSAARDGTYKNMETTMIYTGKLSAEIEIQLRELNGRTMKVFEGGRVDEVSPPNRLDADAVI